MNVKLQGNFMDIELTATLALWGAITGTIGTVAGLFSLWLRLHQHKLDSAKLECTSSFDYQTPEKIKNNIIIRSIGRRPINIDYIRYYVMPRPIFKRIIKRWLHQQGQWIWDQNISSQNKLEEGVKIEESISLPNGLLIEEIYKAEVVDQAGTSWPIKWPSRGKLLSIATKSDIFVLEKEKDNRKVKIAAYRLGYKFYINAEFSLKSNVTARKGFWFLNVSELDKKANDLKDNQIPKFLDEKVEELV